MAVSKLDKNAFALVIATGGSQVDAIKASGSKISCNKQAQNQARRWLKEEDVKTLVMEHALEANHNSSAHLLSLSTKAVQVMEEALGSNDIPLEKRAKIAIDIRKTCNDILPKQVQHTHTHEGIELDDLINTLFESPEAKGFIEGEVVQESRDGETAPESSDEAETKPTPTV